MPLSELYRKLDSTQDKKIAFSSDLPFAPENEFVELVYENGQILMQGAQAGRARKDSILPTHSPKIRDSIGNGSNTRYGKFGMMDCAVNEFEMHRPVGETGLSQDDDLVPWLSYPVDRSDFVSEISGVTGNEVSKRSNTVSVQNGVSSEMRSLRGPPHKPRVSHSLSGQTRADGLSLTRPKRPGLVAPSRGSVLMNFSHFSRPAALAKASIQNKGVTNAESKVPDSSNDLLKETSPDLRPSEDVPPQEPVAVKKSELTRQENTPRDDKSSNQVAESPIKAVEPVIACSSVCSGNSIERPSDDATHNSKRKSRDTEDSEWPSEDVEEESMDGKRAAHARAGTSSKRSRAAEVHNLSERRRRDRINEKMRALQELIPNCNKVDKASMLDEAIEYLKTLQLQVQFMAMGAGLYMPPMMMPPGMPHLGHFSPMVGMGMGMGMGMHYGMGMPDMMQGLPMNGAHFPCLPMPPMSAPFAMHGNAGSNYHSLGPHIQGLPVPVIPPMKPGPTQNLDSPLVSGSKDLTQNANLQAMQNCANSSMNQTSTQCEETNKDLDRPALVQNNSQAAKPGEAVYNAD